MPKTPAWTPEEERSFLIAQVKVREHVRASLDSLQHALILNKAIHLEIGCVPPIDDPENFLRTISILSYEVKKLTDKIGDAKKNCDGERVNGICVLHPQGCS